VFGSCPRLRPPSVQGSFARPGRYPLRRDILCHVSGHYSTFIATTSPCARPKASRRLQFSLYGGSLQVVAKPCWLMALPDVISAILVWALGPLPRSVPLVLIPVSSQRTTVYPLQPRGRHAKLSPQCNFNGGEISGLQSFLYVQAPILARPSDCTHHQAICLKRPGRLRHAKLMRLPTMSSGIATCLNRAIGTTGLSPVGFSPYWTIL